MNHALINVMLLTLVTLFLASFSASADFQPKGTISVVHQAPHTSGPNCWNGALVEAGALEHHRFVAPGEFRFIVDHLCTKVDTPQAGSLGRIFMSSGNQEIHAFVWKTKDSVYAKHSERADESYVIMNTTDMLNQYQSTKECRVKNDFTSEKCLSKTIYYSCDPSHDLDFFNQMLRVKPINSLLNQLAFSSDTELKYKETCESESFKNRSSILKNIHLELVKLRHLGFPLENYFKEWLISAKSQISDSKVGSRNYKCKGQKTREEKYRHYRLAQDALKEIESILSK